MANSKISTEQEEEKNQLPEYTLVPGTGKITINKRDIDEYFGLRDIKSCCSSAISCNRDMLTNLM